MLKVWYLEARDISGRYRWWTEEMARYGQFNHAHHLDQIKDSVIIQERIDRDSIELINNEGDEE